jgi:hypothetical protein
VSSGLVRTRSADVTQMSEMFEQECEARLIEQIVLILNDVGSGAKKKALQMLSTDSKLVINNATVQLLAKEDGAILSEIEGMHPQTPFESSDEWYDQLAPNLTIDCDKLRSIAKSCLNNGSAPGLSGWRANHLINLLQDETIMEGVRCMIQDIINGTGIATDDLGPQ